MIYRILLICFFIVSCFTTPSLVAQTVAPEPNSQEIAANNFKATNTYQQLSGLIADIDATQQELANVKSALIKTKDELDKKALTEKRDKLSQRINELQRNFDSIALGGVDLAGFEKQETKQFDWQEELKEVFRPILDEMKRLTERPRAIEKLRAEKAFLTSRLPIAEAALQKIRSFIDITDDKALLAKLKITEQAWQKRRDDIANQLQLVSFQLEEKLHPSEEEQIAISDQLKSFFSGRGLNILLGIITFFGVYVLFKLLSRALIYLIEKRQSEERRFFEKAIQISFRALSVTLAVFSVVVVFYVQGDWILLGLSFLFLVGFAWTLRQSAPRFITEAKLLLNLGPIRENERVIYNGIPWRVTSINFFTTLTNPALAGGIVNLPVHLALELQSRRFAKDEAWFPTRPGDIVILDDNMFGLVLMQTPEIVTLRVRGGNTKTYATTAFLALNPRNLSHGFGIFTTFGFDYAEQANITRVIPENLQRFINDAMQQQPYAEHLHEFAIEFKDAGASALNLLIITTFDGKAAEHYYVIERFIQRATVDACNHYGWAIPFNQLTVHMANGASG